MPMGIKYTSQSDSVVSRENKGTERETRDVDWDMWVGKVDYNFSLKKKPRNLVQ